MIPRVQYVSFDDANRAVRFMKVNSGRAAFLAGGTDIMVRMRSGKMNTACLVDISNARGLAGIAASDGSVEIGALTTVEEIRRSSVVAKELPALWKASDVFAAWQVRNLATLGGNLCNASPAADLAPPLMVYDATVVALGPGGARNIPIDRFFRGPGQTVLRPGELVEKVVVSREAGGSAFLKLGRRRASTLAVVSVAARIRAKGGRITESRVALGSVAPTPVRARSVERFLEGKPCAKSTFSQAAAIVTEEISPISDVRASAYYRRSMAIHLTAQALEFAALSGGASS
jgi:CO/xanthine dehydrogenase FAD-binding subunit